MEPLVLHIGDKHLSSWSMRAWLALAHTGLPFDEEIIPLDQPDTAARLAAISPSRRVPVLRHGNLVVWDSLAICEYLAETFPDAHLWPAGRKARAVARAVSSEMHAGFAALRQQLPMALRRPVGPTAQDDAARADIQRILTIFSECRQHFGKSGPFLFGAFSVADCMFAPVVTRFDTYAVEMSGEAAAYAASLRSSRLFSAWVVAAQ